MTEPGFDLKGWLAANPLSFPFSVLSPGPRNNENGPSGFEELYVIVQLENTLFQETHFGLRARGDMPRPDSPLLFLLFFILLLRI